jgi:uncharacterized protein
MFKQVSGKISKALQIVLILSIRGYRLMVSPWLGNNCRFFPTCSQYAIEAIQQWGVFKGSWLMIKRLLRCHPGCDGGCDPVPGLKELEA